MTNNEIEYAIYRAQRKLKWLIDGWQVHCIPTDLWSGLTIERIIELYNVDESYFIKTQLITNPNASIAIEIFHITPQIRWQVRLKDNKHIKVLQQLHLGNMGTEQWTDVPIIN